MLSFYLSLSILALPLLISAQSEVPVCPEPWLPQKGFEMKNITAVIPSWSAQKDDPKNITGYIAFTIHDLDAYEVKNASCNVSLTAEHFVWWPDDRSRILVRLDWLGASDYTPCDPPTFGFKLRQPPFRDPYSQAFYLSHTVTNETMTVNRTCNMIFSNWPGRLMVDYSPRQAYKYNYARTTLPGQGYMRYIHELDVQSGVTIKGDENYCRKP